MKTGIPGGGVSRFTLICKVEICMEILAFHF
jgi:hypothetical protein